MILPRQEWTQRRRRHTERVDALVGDHLQRRRNGEKHPVADFLFTYYSYRPGQLRRWHPGPGVALAQADPAEFGPEYTMDTAGNLTLDRQAVLAKRGQASSWIHDLLVATASRQPHYGCFGMHEWAMVYRQDPAQTRHNRMPLRLGPAGTADLVEEIKVRCSHFDAFRFFTPAARPLNQLQPTRETQAQHEQPGCLHANMDVYRWAYKLSPLVPSELVADCFELAAQIRLLDMRASPYDLSSMGVEPLPIETADGRAEYVRQQRDFAARAGQLRAKLIAGCARVL
ncbi:hypothetical protein Rhe02_25680 [Rhizocola hellebori]|uniref:3-methyladenine DNA glycosylase n=1 Tax=Rhizocola hellebori TaxID=1392758 RepID=A0A8J3Q641_9ACTN|nr:3-methyladenine DNA glycosylase [Rhizocola hellebori]GIH04501.1 hypothetical protein Rhe02_25680 [Rhizocola hellebori]